MKKYFRYTSSEQRKSNVIKGVRSHAVSDLGSHLGAPTLNQPFLGGAEARARGPRAEPAGRAGTASQHGSLPARGTAGVHTRLANTAVPNARLAASALCRKTVCGTRGAQNLPQSIQILCNSSANFSLASGGRESPAFRH